MVNTTKSPHYDFYKQQVDKAIKDCGMWNDRVRLIVYTVIITETCDGRPFGWLNYTNPREPQFANYRPNDGDPPDRSWSTQRSGGLYQQQPQFWGPDVMDPYKATVSFLKGYRFPDGRSATGLNGFRWQDVEIWTACQKVQGSEFGDGSNYRRNVPYAQMVIDSDKGDNCMANYGDFDGALDGSTVPYGIDDYNDPNSRRESIRHNLWATNAAAFGAANLLGKIATVRSLVTKDNYNLNDMVAFIDHHVSKDIPQLIKNAVDDILVNRKWPWWNQEGVPEAALGQNSLTESLFATNGRVYHPLWGNKALSDKLDLLVQLHQVAQPNNTEITRLVKEYNDTHVAKVPVVEKLPVEKPGDGITPPDPKDV